MVNSFTVTVAVHCYSYRNPKYVLDVPMSASLTNRNGSPLAGAVNSSLGEGRDESPNCSRGSGNRRGTLVPERGGRAAAGSGMTARAIAETLIAGKAVPTTRKQFVDLQAAVLALRKRDGAAVVGAGAPARWQLKEAAN